ncbi:MAG: DinB family protein, partial [Bacteroidota bacterium]|nr:DinB family protein [Bacteroidota bacterium]
ESESSVKPAPDKWSKKEILGHLIDSASNNHQRFVRAQLSAEITLPAYEQDAWVKTQAYCNESWESLVQLWKSYNRHLLHVIVSIPENMLENYCFIGDSEPVTLKSLIEDYVRHVKHHLEQIME